MLTRRPSSRLSSQKEGRHSSQQQGDCWWHRQFEPAHTPIQPFEVMEAATKSSNIARAAPRRARKDPNEAPVFLQKTYQMIDTVRTREQA